MSEFGDTAIKLFGRTITPLLEANRDPSSSSGSAGDGGHGKETSSSSTSSCSSSPGADRAKSPTDHNHNEDSINYGSKDPQISSDINEDPKTSTETSSPKSLKNNGDQEGEITTTTTTTAAAGTSGRTQEKTTLKKPNKILPCPRCNSTDTKFCYFNNYNVNQPRHFCRKCQRYWTAGGSMRNVPVGAGRRKNKSSANSSNHCLRINPLNNNSSGTILSFGSSSFLVSEVVHDKLHVPVQRKFETVNDHHADDIYKTVDSGSRETKDCQGFLPKQVPFPIPQPPWPYQWNPAVPNANFYPLPYYWGRTVPFMSPPNTSSSLGKHSRDGNLINAERVGKESERNGLVSESLRIDGSDEAAKSSVRSVLGTIPGKSDDKISLFGGFETKGNNSRDFMSETSLALQANPAAVARSLNFSENM